MRFALPVCLLGALSAQALDYPHPPADPQPQGWPLTAAEKAYVTEKPEYERRPGKEINKHLPQFWPSVPSAGYWGGTSWLDTHAKLVDFVRQSAGACDTLLVGDSITQQWGGPLDKAGPNAAWTKRFTGRTVNIGIGGDKTQNVLWRLDHGGVDGLQPKLIVLMIGNNNMFFTPETGVPAAALGIKTCAANLREKFPAALLVVAKILPCHTPKDRFYQDIAATNAELDKLELEKDPKVKVLDLTKDFLNADGSLRAELYQPDKIHLSLAGYEVYARRLHELTQATPPRKQ